MSIDLTYLTNIQLLALDAMFEAIDYEKMPDPDYAKLYDEIENFEVSLEQELKRRQL